MKRFGLIGNPIEHSLSPALFRAGYGNKFSYDLIEGADFETSYRKFLDCYDGINVTAPFKELAFAKADIRSSECQKIGATNLLVKTAEGIKAYNSDYSGILLSILTVLHPDRTASQLLQDIHGLPNSAETFLPRPDSNPLSTNPPQHLKALIVGCGGAGKAAAVAAGDLGFKTVLMNRTSEKAYKIAEALPEYDFNIRPVKEFREAFDEADVIIYTLPAPLPEFDTIFMDTPGKEELPNDRTNRKIILEANYRNPSFTPELLQRLHATYPGLQHIPGQQWLLYQAFAGYKIFTGEVPGLNAMEKVIMV